MCCDFLCSVSEFIYATRLNTEQFWYFLCGHLCTVVLTSSWAHTAAVRTMAADRCRGAGAFDAGEVITDRAFLQKVQDANLRTRFLFVYKVYLTTSVTYNTVHNGRMVGVGQ